MKLQKRYPIASGKLYDDYFLKSNNTLIELPVRTDFLKDYKSCKFYDHPLILQVFQILRML